MQVREDFPNTFGFPLLFGEGIRNTENSQENSSQRNIENSLERNRKNNVERDDENSAGKNTKDNNKENDNTEWRITNNSNAEHCSTENRNVQNREQVSDHIYKGSLYIFFGYLIGFCSSICAIHDAKTKKREKAQHIPVTC